MYTGRNSMVKANDPGIAATVYFVHILFSQKLSEATQCIVKTRTYSDMSAALPRTVRRTAR